MSNYRRVHCPGGCVFLTLVTHQRSPLFSDPENVARLRMAIATVKAERPFDILGAVILPDHLHFVWQLSPSDSNYSARVGQIKATFTKSLPSQNRPRISVSQSRHKHRESNVWQRRFWEHTVRSSAELERVLDYVHYNPVKHGLVDCPHQWPYSSFHRSIERRDYVADWACVCEGRSPKIPDFQSLHQLLGE